MMEKSALYIVATPIGNLADMSQRAIETLKSVNVIAAEDTRHSIKLLQHFGISTPLIAYHDHSNQQQVDRIIDKLKSGEAIALISDAGTPLISDPGYRLVSQVRAMGIKVVTVPGSCAVIAALSASGLPSDRFSFQGFPPPKKGARQKFYEQFCKNSETTIFYESPHRIVDSLEDLVEIMGEERELVFARELTKTYETFITGTLSSVLQTVKSDRNQQKGEMVIMLRGYRKLAIEEGILEASQNVMKVLLTELSTKKAASVAAQLTGEKKNQLYQWALSYQDNID